MAMCVYIVSNDAYFSSGISHHLSEAGVNNATYPLTPESLQNISHIIMRQDVLVVDIDIQFYDFNFPLTSFMFDDSIRVIPVFDVKVNHYYFKETSPLFISKKVSCQFFIELFVDIIKCSTGHRRQLTKSEAVIVNELLEGGGGLVRIANKLGVSIKTVSAHKKNALTKLGVRNSNPVFLIFFKFIFLLCSGKNR